jgi:nucleoid DNA-binding protein
MRELARAVAQQTGLSEQHAQAAVRALLGELIDRLAADGRVRLGDFGIFELKLRRARRGRNPRTGEAVAIPAKILVSFRPGPALGRVLDFLAPDDGPESPPADAGGAKRWWQFWR